MNPTPPNLELIQFEIDSSQDVPLNIPGPTDHHRRQAPTPNPHPHPQLPTPNIPGPTDHHRRQAPHVMPGLRLNVSGIIQCTQSI